MTTPSKNTLTLVTQVMSELGSFGIDCPEDKATKLVGHLELLIEKNKVVNLTRIVDPSSAVTLHVVDSLLPLACQDVRLEAASTFLDIGTGGGFPGIPLGVMTGAHGLLVDSVGKKVKAVNEFISELGVDGLGARHTRVEELAHELPGSQDFVFARAVAQSNVLIEYATPLLRRDGLLVIQKARPEIEELTCAERAAKLCGLSLVSRETFELRDGLGHREILMYRKTSKSKIKLPRRVGLATKEPLGVK